MDLKSLCIGIDVGSTTVKVVVLNPAILDPETAAKPETSKTLFSRYMRHGASQREAVCAVLKEVSAAFPKAVFRAAVCGSGGKPVADILGVPYIQEVVANSIAVSTFYPDVRVAVELGGQDAKVVFFHKDSTSGILTASDMRMNGSCAGGTGAFIDEVATLLRCPIEDFDKLAAAGSSVYDISGRCGVFAKTDIQPLLNQGGVKEDIALSTFHAIAKQTIGGLAQGLSLNPPIIFEGGPFTFNKTLIRVFADRLNLKESDIIRDPNPEILIAIGAALSLNEMFADISTDIDLSKAVAALDSFCGNDLNNSGKTKKPFFTDDDERRAFEEKHRLAPPIAHNAKRGDEIPVFIGIDAGSTTSKFVLIDENENIIDSFYSNNQGDPLRVIKQALIDLKEKYDRLGVKLKVIALGTTGYGELLFDKAFGADYHTVETVAHVAASKKFAGDVSFILDIGGQDMKAINVRDGIVTNITLNEACSSGCGSFLESFARTLNISVDYICEAAFAAKNPAELGSRCTVFMNSTIITEQKNGKNQNDIMAGLCRSIIENVFTKVVRVSNFSELGGSIVVQGGTFKNNAVLRALEQYIEKPVVRSPYPGEMGAIGIALLTKKHITENGYTSPHGEPGKSRFIGLENMRNFDYTQETNIRCNFCTNNCNRTLVTFNNGIIWVTGNRCERGEIVGLSSDKNIIEKVRLVNESMDSVPDMIKFRENILFKDYPFTPVCKAQNITIGLPRVLDFWRNMPFWTTFFKALGFNVVVSKKSSQKLFEKGLQFVTSDTVCFPAKLVHGHILDLAARKVDRIFMPILNRLPSDNTEPESTYTCPVLKGYGLVIKYSDNPEKRDNIPFDTPICHWFTKQDRDNQLRRYAKDAFGIDSASTTKAIKQADAALDEFNAQLVEEGSRVLAETEKRGAFAVVISGRHYQFDELVNHNLSRYFTSLGIPVLTLDSLKGLQNVDLSKTKIDITNNNHARLLAGAIIAAEHPALEYVEVFSFGCGHDALYTDEVQRLMNEISGKSALIIKLDESDISGPLRIRVRSFIETVGQRREKSKNEIFKANKLNDPYPVKFYKENQKNKIILVPNTSVTFSKILAAAFIKQGAKSEALPLCGKQAVLAGKKYLHNDICFPAQVVIGEAVSLLKNGRYNPQDVAIGMAKFNCDCRLTNYTYLLRKALDDAGYAYVPIITIDQTDKKNIHPGFILKPVSFIRSIWTLVMTDILDDICRKVRPYEIEKGETNRVYNECINTLCETLEKKGMWAAYRKFDECIEAMCKVRYNKTNPKPLIFVIGEYIANFHPDCNFYIEDYLEHNNMEVQFPRMYDVFRKYLMHTISEVKDFKIKHTLTEIVSSFGGNLFFDIALNLMEKTAVKHPLYKKSARLPDLAKHSDPIMHRSINSGESFLIATEIMHQAEAGIKSFVILQPFGCLPNHVCGRGVIKRVKEIYPSIQILPLDYDPDTSFANIENRLQMLIMNSKKMSECA
ncbi:2-hydroxyglutaryl-CoA dehydratase [Spirochaetia bacterium]|nr:2-hydroxyglutaryl-CoA dehydratase [Spirochaetia bacterium]